MEDPRSVDRKRVIEFGELLKERVNDAGAKVGRTGRDAQYVVEQLFKQTNGDASKVTDEMISETFDSVDKKDQQE